MKLLLTSILSVMICTVGFCQEFQKTDKFKVIIDEYTIDPNSLIPIPVNGDNTYIRLINTESLEEIFKVPLNSEFYDGQKIEITEDVKLENIDYVVRLKTYYMACCVDETSYYFLATSENNFIQLPEFTETFCDGPEPFIEYTFKNIEDKKTQLIQLTQFFQNQENQIDSTKILKTYRFENGKLNEEK